MNNRKVAILAGDPQGSGLVIPWLVVINSEISQHHRDHLLVAILTCDEDWSGSFIVAQVRINLWLGEKMFHDKGVSILAGTVQGGKSLLIFPIDIDSGVTAQ